MSNQTEPTKPPARYRGKVGVIDLGSNTVLLLVLDDSGRTILDEARITRLGQGVFSSGRLHPEALARTHAALDELIGLARGCGVNHLVAVGTEALRRAADGEAFLQELRHRVDGVDEVHLLTPEAEARHSVEATRREEIRDQKAVLENRKETGRSLAVVDVGGGSTEVSCLEPHQLRADPLDGKVESRSLPLGAVRLTERFVSGDPVSIAELEQLRGEVRSQARRLDMPPVARAVAVAGTATTLAALELRLEPYDAVRVEGVELSASQLDSWILRLAALPLLERQALPGLEPRRADVILAGAVILAEVVAALGPDRLRVSSRGVRWGVAFECLEALQSNSLGSEWSNSLGSE